MQLLLDAAARRAPGQRLARATARLTRPIYVGDTIVLAGSALVDGQMQAWVADAGGALCAQMELHFA
jgi:3-methylfumaryl-CoA hydratase